MSDLFNKDMAVAIFTEDGERRICTATVVAVAGAGEKKLFLRLDESKPKTIVHERWYNSDAQKHLVAALTALASGGIPVHYGLEHRILEDFENWFQEEWHSPDKPPCVLYAIFLMDLVLNRAVGRINSTKDVYDIRLSLYEAFEHLEAHLKCLETRISLDFCVPMTGGNREWSFSLYLARKLGQVVSADGGTLYDPLVVIRPRLCHEDETVQRGVVI